MAYNMTNVTASTNVLEFFVETNRILDDWPAMLLLSGVLILIWVGITISTGESLKGFVSGSFITTIMAFLFIGLDLVSDKIAIASLALFIISLLVLYLGGIRDG